MIRIKICALRAPDEAVAIAQAGANALGVIVAVTARSEHAVAPERAAEIFQALAGAQPALPHRAKRVLVTHETDPARLQRLVDICQLVEEIQLHGPMPDELFAQNVTWLRERGIDAVRALHVPSNPDFAKLEATIVHSQGAIAVLTDSVTMDRLGGTGATHDWSISARLQTLGKIPVFLAGGLKPENLRAAILQVRPAGIDINTGVRTDGRRDLPQSPERVREVVDVVRQAERELAAETCHMPPGSV